jgi:hypothetical protein
MGACLRVYNDKYAAIGAKWFLQKKKMMIKLLLIRHATIVQDRPEAGEKQDCFPMKKIDNKINH